ncbi:hypothetical protein BY996DRAFT_8689018 [Phakopsora pachyrhizi]|nr:hypothetical protein BY996DRAFT_8689018 [Phakopsora pachyrhizi]
MVDLNSDQTDLVKDDEKDQEIRSSIQSILKDKLSQINDIDKEIHRFKDLNLKLSQEVQNLVLERYPKGYKVMVMSQIIQNRNQAGRAGLTSHWDESNDKVIKEVWSNIGYHLLGGGEVSEEAVSKV